MFYWLEKSRLDELIQLLVNESYECYGPQVCDAAIQYRRIQSAADLMQGYRLEQQPGSYRLIPTDQQDYFAWSNGAQAFKPHLFQPDQPQWTCQRDADGRLTFTAITPEPAKKAFIGVKGCDCAALGIHDKHFLMQESVDAAYQTVRNNMFIVAVDCLFPAQTCFCHAQDTGPEVRAHYDLVLTEMPDGFCLRFGSSAGEAYIHALNLQTADAARLAQRQAGLEQAAGSMSRKLPAGNLYAELQENIEHNHWQQVAQRCLACGNCTAVCPTCFCFKEHTQVSPDTSHAIQRREWSSCFSDEHNYLHGFQVRPLTSQRYRQWLTHKLGSWYEQYGCSGCVGCGRCITWCPVGIDITAEVAAVTGAAG